MPYPFSDSAPGTTYVRVVGLVAPMATLRPTTVSLVGDARTAAVCAEAMAAEVRRYVSDGFSRSTALEAWAEDLSAETGVPADVLRTEIERGLKAATRTWSRDPEMRRAEDLHHLIREFDQILGKHEFDLASLLDVPSSIADLGPSVKGLWLRHVHGIPAHGTACYRGKWEPLTDDRDDGPVMMDYSVRFAEAPTPQLAELLTRRLPAETIVSMLSFDATIGSYLDEATIETWTCGSEHGPASVRSVRIEPFPIKSDPNPDISIITSRLMQDRFADVLAHFGPAAGNRF